MINSIVTVLVAKVTDETLSDYPDSFMMKR